MTSSPRLTANYRSHVRWRRITAARSRARGLRILEISIALRLLPRVHPLSKARSKTRRAPVKAPDPGDLSLVNLRTGRTLFASSIMTVGGMRRIQASGPAAPRNWSVILRRVKIQRQGKEESGRIKWGREASEGSD